MLFSFKKKPTTSSDFSEFMRNASAREQKRVFKKVIEESIKDQQAVIERADRIIAKRNRAKSQTFLISPRKLAGNRGQDR